MRAVTKICSADPVNVGISVSTRVQYMQHMYHMDYRQHRKHFVWDWCTCWSPLMDRVSSMCICVTTNTVTHVQVSASM